MADSFTLPPDLAEFVQSKVASGNYETVDDIICAALRLLMKHHQETAELRRKIDKGLEDFARGDYIEIADEAEHKAFFDELKAEVLKRPSAAGAQT